VKHYSSPLRKAINRLRVRIPKHIEEFGRLGRRDRLRFAVAKLRGGSVEAFTRLTAKPGSYARRHVACSLGNSKPLQRAYRRYSIAIRRYRRRPYEGTITIVATDERLALDPSLGWGREPVEIHSIKGEHDTYLRDQAPAVAAVLRTCLDRTEDETGRLRLPRARAV